MESINLAVFGAGYWGKKLCTEYLAIQESTGEGHLSYIADSSASALQAVAIGLDRFKIRFVTDYKEVLNDGSIQGVHIALPNNLHYTVAKASLEAGKHVLLEKPIATNSREAFKLARLAEEKGLVLQVGHIFRFNNAIRTVKELIREGRLGRIFYAKLSWATFMVPPLDRDIIFDLAPHPVDVLNYLLDEWPTNVDAIGDSFHRNQDNLEEFAFVNLEFPDRIVANVYLSWIQHGAKERSVCLVGEKGTIYCDALDQKVILKTTAGHTMEISPYSLGIGNPIESVDGSPNYTPNNTIRDMHYHFLETVRGRGPQLNTALVGAQTVEVLENITKVMRSKKKFQEYPEQNVRSMLVR